MTTSYLWSVKYSLEGAQSNLMKVVADTIQQAITLVEKSDDRSVTVVEIVLVDLVHYQPSQG